MENKKKDIEKNQEIETNNKKLKEKFKIDDLLNPVFKDKSKKSEIIQILYPFFSLKVDLQNEINRVYSTVEKIDPEKIEIIEECEYEEKKFDSKNKFITKCKSVSLNNFNQKEENLNKYLENFIAFIP